MPAKTLHRGLLLAGSFLILASLAAASDDKTNNDKPALSGVWVQKGGEPKVEFSDKKVLKISPHGDNVAIAIICRYTVAGDGLVKANVTGFDGEDGLKEVAKGMLPPGTEFTFKWRVKDETAQLDDLNGERIEPLKSHLEGEYSRKKN